MEKTVYAFIQEYHTTTAESNRVQAMLKAFCEMGLKVQLVCIGIAETSYPLINGLTFVELRHSKKRLIKGDYYYQYFLSYIRLHQFIRKLPLGATVLLVGCRNHLHQFVDRKDLRLYEEVSEHYTVIRSIGLRRYLKCCLKLNGLFVISTSLKNSYQEIGIPANRIHIINMFADERRFSGLKKESIEPPYIAYCGNMSNTKDGVDLLLEAFCMIADKTNLNLWLIGKYKGEYDDFVKRRGIERRVVFTGAVVNYEVPQKLMNASILALARPDSVQAANGFPTKLGEYLLTGNPVVLTKTGDIPLFLKDKNNALLSDSKDIKQFADNLLWVIKHPKEAQEIGERGKQLALTQFNSFIESKKMFDVMFG